MLKALRHHFRTVFVAGLLLIIPIWITFVLLRILAVNLDGVFGPQVPKLSGYLGYAVKEVPGLGIIIMVLAVYIAGLFARNLFGRQIVTLTDRILGKVPIVRTVYLASKQLLETVALQQSDGFKRVVLIEYPRRGIYVLAFVTSETRGEVQEQTRQDMLNIFVPTTPNPTSGFLIFLPKEETIPLNMSIEDGIKYVVSGGFVVPHYIRKANPAEAALPEAGTPPAGEPQIPAEGDKVRTVNGEESPAR